MKQRAKRPLFPWEASSLGLSWLHSIGRKDNPNAGREIILTNQLVPFKPLDAVVVARRFNLGNHIRQVSNAVRFAELNGIPFVRLPEGSIFSPGSLGSIQLISSDAAGRSHNQNEIYADFFYFQRYGLSAEQLERARVTQALRSNVSLLSDSVSIPRLGIHLRAGDTFADRPHPLYMPPPLRFFLDAIEESEAAKVGGVHLVCQELNHPYIGPIKAYCLDREIRCHVSSSSLEEDFKTLASFKELCLSQGTLALAAAWLSSHCKRIYAFQREDGERNTSVQLGIEVRHASACEELGPWTGAERQMNYLADPSSTELLWRTTGSLA